MNAKSKPCPECGGAMNLRLGDLECSSCGYTERAAGSTGDKPNTGPGQSSAARRAMAQSGSSLPGSWNYAPAVVESSSSSNQDAADAPEALSSTARLGWFVITALAWAIAGFSYLYYYVFKFAHYGGNPFLAMALNLVFGCPAWILLIGIPYMVGLACWHGSLGRYTKSLGWSLLIGLSLTLWLGVGFILSYAAAEGGGNPYSPSWALFGGVVLMVQVLHWGNLSFKKTHNYNPELRAIAIPAYYICLVLVVPSLLAAFSILSDTAESNKIIESGRVKRNQQYEQVMNAVGFVEYPGMDKSTYLASESSNSDKEEWLEIQFDTNDSAASVYNYYEPKLKQAGLTVHRAHYKNTGMPGGKNVGLLAYDVSSKKAFKAFCYDRYDGSGSIQVQISISTSISADYESHLRKIYVFTD